MRFRSNSRGYQALRVDDDSEEEPAKVTDQRTLLQPNYYHFVARNKKDQSKTCVWIMLCLSVSGILFLSFIAHRLETDSIYIKVSAENKDNKRRLAAGVEGAIVMYVITAIFLLWQLLKRPSYSHRHCHD